MSKQEAKARGSKHHSNKKKYNKYIPAKAEKQKILASNWDRYESKCAESPIRGSDFALLASAPITHGSHFQFKSNDLDGLEEPEESDLFSLDLVLLEKSLATLPFTLRSGIDERFFSEKQLKIMNQLEENKKDFANYLKSKKFEKNNEIFHVIEVETINAEEIQRTEVNEPETKQDELEAWLDDILDE